MSSTMMATAGKIDVWTSGEIVQTNNPDPRHLPGVEASRCQHRLKREPKSSVAWGPGVRSLIGEDAVETLYELL
jgi:hypothetical protein